jgi:hypothetical protein
MASEESPNTPPESPNTPPKSPFNTPPEDLPNQGDAFEEDTTPANGVLARAGDFQIQLEGAFKQDEQDGGVLVSISAKALKGDNRSGDLSKVTLKKLREVSKL